MDKRCLWCDQPVDQELDFWDCFLPRKDPLCKKCRTSLAAKRIPFRLEGVKGTFLYPYEGLYKSMLLQFKEGMDEALAPCFLYPYIKEIKRKYHGYTLVPIPSSLSKQQYRGFDTLPLLFRETKLPLLDVLEKEGDWDLTGTSKEEREEKGKRICLKKEAQLRKVLLVDDVLTTGSTLRGALRALEGSTQHVEILVLAGNKRFRTKREKLLLHPATGIIGR